MVRQIKRNLMEADRANDHLFDTTPTNSPPKSHHSTMRNGNQSRFHEYEAGRKENGISTELLQGSTHDSIDEKVEDDDRDDDDERYEHEFDFEDPKIGSYGARVHSGYD